MQKVNITLPGGQYYDFNNAYLEGKALVNGIETDIKIPFFEVADSIKLVDSDKGTEIEIYKNRASDPVFDLMRLYQQLEKPKRTRTNKHKTRYLKI